MNRLKRWLQVWLEIKPAEGDDWAESMEHDYERCVRGPVISRTFVVSGELNREALQQQFKAAKGQLTGFRYR